MNDRRRQSQPTTLLAMLCLIRKTLIRKRTERKDNAVSDIRTAASDCFQQYNGWKTHNARCKSRYCVYSRERDIYFLEVEAEACARRIPITCC